MAGDPMNDKYSVKNLLFYRAIPNYKLPDNVDGHTLYSCKDCGDRFILESSYNYHIQRKSVQITYKCRHCNRRIIFYNRCNLLSHIRSHTFKTATINVSDLKIDPLPLSFYKGSKKDVPNTQCITIERPKQKQNNFCYECKKDITGVGPTYKDRANHYMEYTNELYSCPVCLFTLPTLCALKAHLRIHKADPPFYCPECGIHMPNKSIIYPYNHSCEGFNMMRATTRRSCPVENCIFFHPNDFKQHMKEKHLKKIFSCPSCVVACFHESTMEKHLKTHEKKDDALIFYQCELCPGRLVMQTHVNNHLLSHKLSDTVYPCWICNTTFKEITDLMDHHIQKHDQTDDLKNCLKNLNSETMKKMYRVVKRCDQCSRNFTYKCHYEDINILPNACPYKCTPSKKSSIKNNSKETGENKIICPLCKDKVDINWINMKNHFAQNHKEHRCVDIKLSLPKICVKKYLKEANKKKLKSTGGNFKKRSKKNKKRILPVADTIPKELCVNSTKNNEMNNSHICGKCQGEYETKEALETHITKEHRDPLMAYQCMECGDCFVVKPSFSIHLLFHGISDVDEYIKNKTNCYNEMAYNKNTNDVIGEEERLDENQCKICRERFDDLDDLEKHFRVHGMAFLMKNSLNKPVLP